ncbi:MAG: hypothetical protein HYV47_03990 [Candidatus Nealsonbacteria bacterium]|nr:hypothetical protein [Candidatus Nealsonbacteria bacterium]
MEILPAITTIFDWQSKVEEIKKIGLEEVALFPTCLNPRERGKLYDLLKGTKIKKIPFVHLRSDMAKDEIYYLIKNYHTRVFNMHTKREYPYPPDCQEYRDMIYIENTYDPFDEKEIQEFAGICLDFAHLANSKIFKSDMYSHNIKLIEKYGCGCNHVAPAKNYSIFEKEVKLSEGQHAHILDNLSELDYLKEFPKKYFGKFVALELENSIKEQLEAKNYISGIIKIA